MKDKNYNVDWDAGFAAPMSATVPAGLGGLRLDQALARLFPQYSRNRLQAWLKSGHIRVEGAVLEAKDPVAGGERVLLEPPPPPADVPQAQRMPLKIVHEDAALIVIDKPAGLVVHPGAGQPDGTLLNALLAHSPRLAAVPRAGIVPRHRPSPRQGHHRAAGGGENRSGAGQPGEAARRAQHAPRLPGGGAGRPAGERHHRRAGRP
jgi:hypothetical protein